MSVNALVIGSFFMLPAHTSVVVISSEKQPWVAVEADPSELKVPSCFGY